jgi:hypothetical protein
MKRGCRMFNPDRDNCGFYYLLFCGPCGRHKLRNDLILKTRPKCAGHSIYS